MATDPCTWLLPSPPKRWSHGCAVSQNAVSRSRAECDGIGVARVFTFATLRAIPSSLRHREHGRSIRAVRWRARQDPKQGEIMARFFEALKAGVRAFKEG